MTGVAAEPAWIEILLLGVLQGLAEFLPVSSSGHLVLGREWLGLSGGESLSREVALHLGTLLAVIVACRKDVVSLLHAGSGGLWRLLVGSTVVTGALGLPLKGFIEHELNDLRSAGAGLLVTSLLLIVVAPARPPGEGRSLASGTWRDALVLGLFQTLALVPGISRSGSTIAAGLVLGFARPDAVRVAFVMSIPVVAGAVLLDLVDGGLGRELARPSMLAAIVVAGGVGLLALAWIRVNNDRRSLVAFGCYTAALGVAALATA